MAIALATMYRTLVAQRAVTAQRAAAAAAAAPPAPRQPSIVTIAQKLIGTPAPVLQYRPRPAVSVASMPTPALEFHACGGRCGSLPSSGAASGGMPAASAAPSLSLASTSALPAPATADSAKVKADPDPAAPAEESGLPLLIWILIAVAIWWVVTRERGGRSLW